MAVKGIPEFISEATLGQIPAAGIHGAKRNLLDTVGVILAGCHEEVTRLAVEALGKHPSASGSPVIGYPLATEPCTAALLNGVAAHALDYDDSSETMFGHPSGELVSALLSVAPGRAVTGADLLLAYAVGVEVESKLSNAVPDHYDWGWHNTSTLGSIGAAAASAKLLGLDLDATGMAVGIGASLASGIKQNFGTMTKPLHMGNAARNGVLAGLLAENGFTADQQAVGGPQGFAKVYSGSGSYNMNAMLESLGNPWEVADPGLRVKLYACCTSNHRPVEAAVLLSKEYNIDPAEIERVDCGVIYKVPDILIRSDPRSGVEAKFCLQYCVARALVSGRLSISHFDQAQVLDPSLRPLMAKVFMYVHPEGRKETMTRQLAEVTIKMRDGRTLTRKVYEQEGHPLRPLSDEQVRNKFIDCATRVLRAAEAQRLMDYLWDIENKPSVQPVLDILTGRD